MLDDTSTMEPVSLYIYGVTYGLLCLWYTISLTVYFFTDCILVRRIHYCILILLPSGESQANVIKTFHILNGVK